MSLKTEQFLFSSRLGRITIHLVLLERDHKINRHLQGIFREFKNHRLKAA